MSTEPASRWSADQVLALAPDPASVVAARKLAVGGAWSGVGGDASALWGSCAGSGKNPYLTVVDLSGPAYTCSCPSRKFPCKHTLGLLLGWAQGAIEVPAAEPPQFAADWLASRTARAAKAAEKAEPAAAKPVDADAQAKRAAARAEKVSGGLIELQRWTQDQVRTGLAQLQGKGYRPFETVAARLVDAQASGAAGRVRGLPGVLASGPSWPDLMLEEMALLNLLARAHERLDEVGAASPALAASIRAHVGYPVAKAEVLASEGTPDDWVVLAVRDTLLETLAQRTVYVYGVRTGELATLLSYAPVAGGGFDLQLSAGQQVRARLHRYPGSRARALLGEGETSTAAEGFAASVAAGPVEEALRLVAGAVADDPWLRGLPVVVGGQPVQQEGGWFLVDPAGAAIELSLPEPWGLVNACGGRACPVLVEWTPTRWVPLAVVSSELGVVSL